MKEIKKVSRRSFIQKSAGAAASYDPDYYSEISLWSK
jgi:hypothetical protein